MMARQTPTVSVVIPLFNAERYVEQALRSVRSQTIRDIETIVIDDGSTDQSAPLVAQIARSDPRVVLNSFGNSGVADARNRGLAMAEGRYIAFLDPDDLWYDEKLARQIAVFESEPDMVVVGSLMHYLGANGRVFGATAQTPTKIDRGQVAHGLLSPFPISSALFRTSTVREVGGFRRLFPPGPAMAEDLYIFGRAAQVGRIGCVREPLGCYRVYGESAMGSRHKQMFAAVQYVQQTLADPTFPNRTDWETFLDQQRSTRAMRRWQEARFSYRQGGLAALERRWAAAARHFGRAFLLRPGFTLRRGWRQLRGSYRFHFRNGGRGT
jgi:glycosyltransferase involved in cell wall biosynthesis